jgi:hypothetical protein
MARDSAELRDKSKQEGRLARSWRLSRIAWQVVRSDRAILSLALVSTMFAAAGLALIYDLTGVFSGHQHRSGGHLAIVTLILAFPLTFLSTFFNTAIAAAAAGVLDGKRLSLREALTVPARRIGQVAVWSLLASGVGVLIGQIAQRLPLVGSLAVRLVGLSWSLASLFAIPILATEGCSAPECLRQSASLVKKRWGEGISGNVIITAWAVAAIVPVGIILGVAIGAARAQPGVRVGLFAALVIVSVLIMAASGVIRQTFDVVLYRYAMTGTVAGGFSEADLDAPFGRGIAGLGTSATEPRARPTMTTLWPWLASAAIGGAIVLLLELNKHHYAAHRLSGRVVAAVGIWLLFTALARFVIWLISRASRL